MVTFSQIKKVNGNIPWDGYKIFLAIKSQLKENAGNILGSNWSNEANNENYNNFYKKKKKKT